MKYALALAATLSLFSVPAFSVTPSDEMLQVTRALVNNPQIVSKLAKNKTDHLTDVEIITVKDNVFQYKLTFDKSCECIPSIAKVDILEDLTPTYRNGPAKYTSKVDFIHAMAR